MTPSPASPTGATLHGRYVLGEPLDTDATGSTHPARDLVEDRSVAVTVLHPGLAADPAAEHEFLGRARLLASVTHPGLARVLDQGRDGGLVYAVTEHVEGEPVAGGGQSARHTPRTALSVAADVLSALQALHSAGTVHGGLRADCVRLGGDGRARVARLPMLLGAPGAAAPETRADVYAVGALLYALLVGVSATRDDRPLRPSSAVPGLPPDVDMLVAGATDPNPRYRPRDAGQYLALVERVLRSLPGGAAAPAPAAAVPTGPDTAAVTAVLDAGAPGAQAARPDTRESDPVVAEPAREDSRRRLPVLLGAGALAALLVGAVVWALLPDTGDDPGTAGSARPSPARSTASPSEESDPDPSTSADDAVLTPHTIGLDRAEAVALLESLGLEARIVERPSDAAPAGTVVDQDVPSGEPAPEDGVVTLTVSSGPAEDESPDAGADADDTAGTDPDSDPGPLPGPDAGTEDGPGPDRDNPGRGNGNGNGLGNGNP
ncbi:PASTA domain-containing protein [Nocardiopsis sp. FIRDI 009]|uniref:PASTA domain-containing protein n=1 Tax=Nocardiopsis sp. FIRDI 009 TaxID=714197 RepID=UPI000E269931|nr:PASTA domain-containing protein [Nocardiopsis sp. FIRDI 009]